MVNHSAYTHRRVRKFETCPHNAHVTWKHKLGLRCVCLIEKSCSTYFSRYAIPANTLRSWTKDGGDSSSVTFLLLRITPAKRKERQRTLILVFSIMCLTVFVCLQMIASTQGCVEADAHQVKPIVFYIFSRVESVLPSLKWLVR